MPRSLDQVTWEATMGTEYFVGCVIDLFLRLGRSSLAFLVAPEDVRLPRGSRDRGELRVLGRTKRTHDPYWLAQKRFLSRFPGRAFAQDSPRIARCARRDVSLYGPVVIPTGRRASS